MLSGLKYVSLQERGSGYADAARAWLKALMEAGVPLTWTPMIGGTGQGLYYRRFHGTVVGDPQLDSVCNRSLDYRTVLVHTVPEYFPLWREWEPGKRLIGHTVWETDRLPRHWPALLNGLDHLLVPSQWNMDVCRHNGVTVPIDVLPYLPRAGPPAGDSSFAETTSRDFIFYTIGNWTNRKAVWNTLLSYLQAFTAQDRVILVVKTSPQDFTGGRLAALRGGTEGVVRRIVKRFRAPAHVHLVTDHLPDSSIAALHARGDCFVSLCHSEGWGLPAYDAAAAGKPIIMTGFGGQLDYLRDDLAYLVDYRLVPVDDPPGRPSYAKDQRWAEPDLSHAAFLMREVFSNRSAAEGRGRRLAEHVRRAFDPDALMSRLARVLEPG
ncbi:MAG: glycosyltransferase [Acidobacteria bacterium]|nr:glycosyltransferase [Acidobacteriota bacterium]